MGGALRSYVVSQRLGVLFSWTAAANLNKIYHSQTPNLSNIMLKNE